MYCGECAYNIPDPDGAVCRRCGRYLSEKPSEYMAFLAASVVLAATSNYLLTARVLSGDKMLWVRSALTAPGSIYSSHVYLAAVIVSLAGTLALAALAGFHYGSLPGLLAMLPAGIVWGPPVGWIVLPLVAVAAGLPKWRRFPAVTRPAVAALGGGLFLVWLAAFRGPSHSTIHREVVVVVTSVIAALAVTAALAAAIWARRVTFASSHLPYFAVALTAATLILTGIGASPSRLEANMILTLYAPEKVIEGPLGEGFTSGIASEADARLAEAKQVGHVLEAVRFVDIQRMRAVQACQRYLDRFPASQGAPDVMLLMAAMYDARVNMRALKNFNRLECYYDMVMQEGADVFALIVEKHPGTPQAALARFHVAQWRFQTGKITEALETYVQAERQLAAALPASFSPVEVEPARTAGELFRRTDERKIALLNRLHAALLTSQRRRSLITENRDYGGQPLVRFAALDPYDEDFEAKATQLAADYRDSLIADNVRLALASRMGDPVQRAAALERLLEEYPSSDVRDEMLYLLARAYLAGNLTGDGPRKAEAALRRLLADRPQSTWAEQARALLARVAPSGGAS